LNDAFNSYISFASEAKLLYVVQGGEKSSPDSLDTLLQKMESFRAQSTLPDR